MRARRHWRGILLCAASLAAAPASAERLALTWSAPDGCPTAPEVSREVDRLLGDRPDLPARTVTVAAVVAQPRPGAWQIRLTTPGEGGPARTRVVEGESCAAVADAAAVILALLIDPTAVLKPPKPASRPASRPAIVPARARVAPASAPVIEHAAPQPRAPASVRVSVAAAIDAGSLPGAAAGVAVEAALVLGRLRLMAGFAAWPQSSGTVADRPTAGGQIDLLVGELGICRSLFEGRFELGPCAGLDLGRLHASGYGVANPGEGSSVWVALRGGVLAGWRLRSRIGLVLQAGAVAPLVRPTFVLTNVGSVHRPGAVAGRAALGVEVHF